jgi:8-hydroxy-5-deazaflavin:NADPH oxidoreductase
MRIGVLGTGMVGRVIGARFAALGHGVTIGTRDVEALLSRTGPDPMGNEPFATWTAKNPRVALGTFAEAAAAGDVLVNATNGSGSLDALRSAGEDNLSGKVLIDISNPLDYSRGMPPALFVSNTDSLGEQIQRAFPGARVVKTLNTMNAFVMADPSLVAGGQHSVFVCGNDQQAKGEVPQILRSFRWEDILDLGDITSARGTETYLACG